MEQVQEFDWEEVKMRLFKYLAFLNPYNRFALLKENKRVSYDAIEKNK